MQDDEGDFFHGLKIAMLAELFAACIIVAGIFAFQMQTVIRF